jgi:protein-L-isoaspartate(D-aspartate) O-methyltransferase
VPEALREQLVWPGGILVIPVGSDVQTMLKITRHTATEYSEQTLENFRFVPFLTGVAKK